MKIKITHVPTGESVIHEEKEFDGYDPEWMWTEGNYGCDCNRYLFFERAKGNYPNFSDCPPCGEKLYIAELLG